MKINLTKFSHIIFFILVLPGLSYILSLLFFKLFNNLPFWIETLSPLTSFLLFYSLFDKYLWKFKIFSVFGVVNVPDLNGRWVGTQRSSYKKNGQNICISSCLEIVQTFSKIIIRSYYEKSKSENTVADFYDINGEGLLYYNFDNDPNSLKQGTMQRHRGTVKLRYVPRERKLIGEYYNDIGNNGEMTFNYEQDSFLCRFQ